MHKGLEGRIDAPKLRTTQDPGGLPKARGTSSHQVRFQPATSTEAPALNDLDSLESSKTPEEDQPQKDSPYVAGITCFNCHEVAHFASKCPKK